MEILYGYQIYTKISLDVSFQNHFLGGGELARGELVGK